MTARRDLDPATRAAHLVLRRQYMNACKVSKDPNASDQDRQDAENIIDNYFAWVETNLPKIGPT